MKKLINTIFIALLLCVSVVGCNDFLERDSETVFDNEKIFKDENMIKSVLANYYGRINWGQHLDDTRGFALLDEAAFSHGGPNNQRDYNDYWWVVYDYGLIRHLNLFLEGLKSNATAHLTATRKKELEGEVRFIRAWTYFNMCKGLGGVPLVGDKVFDYSPGDDVTALQVPRATEAATYDYVISECTAAASLLPDDPSKNINAARANKWVALSLKARAALYAGSLAKYNNLVTPNIVTPGLEVGIPVARAQAYYDTAYATANKIILSKKYKLYDTKLSSDKGRNFYEALTQKSGNSEVIWALDYFYPGKTNEFTKYCVATSVKGDIDANIITPILNLVEDYEYIDNRVGKLKLKNAAGDYIYYNNLNDVFANKDARLDGTIICPGATFRSEVITYLAGQKYWKDGKWENRIGKPGEVTSEFGLITDQNGPVSGTEENTNKTGFNIRKFVDENKDASTRGRGSDVWFVRFRFAEILMIAAEAALELGKPQAEVCEYINLLRRRGGIQDLSNVNIRDIEQERRVEFAYENHRWWDLKRWRRAHIVWDGSNNTESAVHYVLFPYKINQVGNVNHGKYVFDKLKTNMTENPRNFRMQNYYNFWYNGWINSNPKLVKNPYQ